MNNQINVFSKMKKSSKAQNASLCIMDLLHIIPLHTFRTAISVNAFNLHQHISITVFLLLFVPILHKNMAISWTPGFVFAQFIGKTQQQTNPY